MRRRLVFGLGLALLTCGAATLILYRNQDKIFPADVRAMLDAPDSFEFMTIDPSMENFDPKRAGTLHGYAILGRTTIADTAQQKRLVGALYQAAHQDGPASGCIFQPRHAIRATRGGQVVDMVVCFQCGQLEVFKGDDRVLEAQIRTDGPIRGDFDAVANAAGLKVAP